MEIPVVDRSSVILGQRIATGAGGILYEGRMKTESGWREVVVKEVTVPVSGQEYQTELKSIANTAFVAGKNVHVCEVYGVSLSEKDCWYVHRMLASALDLVNAWTSPSPLFAPHSVLLSSVPEGCCCARIP